MRASSESHKQLVSLQKLWLDDRAIDFEQGFLTIGAAGWSCTLRGVSSDDLLSLEGELALRARALDGRTIEGRLSAPSSSGPAADEPAVVELAGLGEPLIEGRKF